MFTMVRADLAVDFSKISALEIQESDYEIYFVTAYVEGAAIDINSFDTVVEAKKYLDELIEELNSKCFKTLRSMEVQDE